VLYPGTMTTRTYGQHCALAKTLDLVGERWTLLIVRELIVGPKRYSDLLDALPGIGTNLLARRLKRLEAEGLVRRRRLAPPAGSTVYQLTSTGAELALALLPITLWGARHALGSRREGEVFRAEWPLLLLIALVDQTQTADVHDTYAFRVDDSSAHLVVDDGRITVHHGEPDDPPDVTVTVDLDTFIAVGGGRLDPAQATSDGRLRIEGEPAAVRRFRRLIPVGR
jgi:DNA-binding HxlR family transcriptional regulator